MKNIFKEYFSYSRSETRSIIAVLSVLAIAVGFRIYITSCKSASSDPDYVLPKNIYTIIKSMENSCNESFPDKFHEKKDMTDDKKDIIPGNFDPNTASFDTMVIIGLRKDIVRNIIRYRNAGGRFRYPEDIRKIYGMNDSIYENISRYIKIKEERIPVKRMPDKLPETPASKPSDNTLSLKLIELNNSDTITLKTIKGIGSVFAARIVKYRELLGGFYSYDQVFEISGMDSLEYLSLIRYTELDASFIRKINLNTASEKEIRSHPYISAYYARSIIYYKQITGEIDHIEELLKNEVLPPEVFIKCRPYFCLQE